MRQFTHIILFSIATIIQITSCYNIAAQEVMSLKACMEYAVENSTKMLIGAADLNDAQVGRREAIMNAFSPEISANTYAYSNFGRSVDPESNTYNNVMSFNNGYSISAGITLFNGFEAINNMQVAKITLKMGTSKLQQTRDEICLATMEAYYNLVFYSHMQQVFEAYVATATNNLKLTQLQYRQGQKGYADVVQTEAELADRQFQLIDMQNRKNEATLTLKALMLWPVGNDLQIDLSMIADSTAMGQVLHNADTAKQLMIDYAKEQTPRAVLAKGTLENARLALKTAKWNFVPKLSLSGGWNTSYFTYPGMDSYKPAPFKNQFKNNSGEYIQIALHIPIYDRLAKHSNIARKKNAYKRATYEYEQTLHEIEAEVTRALQASEGARAALSQARKRWRVQEEAFRLNSNKLAQGIISTIDYQTAANAFLNAKAELIDALLKFYLKNSVLMYYKGINYLEQ